MAHADDSSKDLGAGRRCHVTLLFSDLCDYTSLSEAADPEDVAAVLHTVKNAASDIVEKHRGTLNQFYGDGFLAVFGLPTSNEDDARRAAEAALELHEKLRELRFELAGTTAFHARLHSGVHSGLVFARASDARDGRYQIVGDPINTAARLCSAAGADEILASEAALRSIAPFFETRAVAPLRLKGKIEPLPAVRLLGKSGISTRFQARTERGLTPFVGRAPELARLSTALTRALVGSWSLIHVVGDVGLGKTRLLSEYRRRCVGARANVFSGSSEHYGHVPPLQPFLQVLRQIFDLHPELGPSECARRVQHRAASSNGQLEPHLPALLELLAPRGPRSARAAEETSDAVASAIVELLLALARQHPVVLVLDDWQWADDASYRVVGQLLQTLAERSEPLLIITAARALDADDPIAIAGEVIELLPLGKAEAEQAITGLLPHAPDVGVVASIEQRAGGNPLFLEELCQSWPNDSQGRDIAGLETIPNLLHAVIQARVESLPAELGRVVRAAAVVGSEFDARLLERIAGVGDLPACLKQLSEQALIYPTDRAAAYRFKHGVTRDVVYDSVRIVERKRLHAAIADALSAKHGDASAQHWEALAYHYAGAGKSQRAAHFAELSGDKAAASSSLDRARQHYRAALAELERLPSASGARERWLAVSRKWAAACVFSPAPEHIHLLSRALEYTEHTAESSAVAHSHYWLGWIYYALGEQERAIAHTEQALQLTDPIRDRKLIAQLLANLGQVHAIAAHPEQALDCLERAAEIKREHAKPLNRAVPVGFVYALGCQGLVHGYLGDFTQAYEKLASALDTVRGTRHAIEASLLGLLGMVQLWQGSFAECLSTAGRMRRAAERVRGPYVFAISRILSGYARWMLERDPRGRAELESAVEWLEKRRIRLLISFGFACLAEVLADEGRTDAARAYAALALERAEQLDRLGELTARRLLASSASASPASAEQLREAGALARARGSKREAALADLELARALERAGDHAAGGELKARARAEFQALGMAWHAERTETA